MPHHTASIAWTCEDTEDFYANRYTRVHEWRFDGGAVVPASASPDVVKPPLSDPAGVDPEEAFLASIASCHMLWFLDIARRAGHGVTSYTDTADARLVRSSDGKMRIERVELKPDIAFADPAPSDAEIEAMHEEAHELCFIANSIRAEVVVLKP